MYNIYLILQAIAKEYQRIIKARHGTEKIDEKDCYQIRVCQLKVDKRKQQ